MEKNKTNESMNTGHPIAAEIHTKATGKDIEQDLSDIEIEKDADEQVHESVEEIVLVDEIDLDDVIHHQPVSPAKDNDETDLDDLVHRNG